jgi:hypothetical protein
MQVPPVSRRALCVLALGAAACGVLASAPEAIDKTPKCKRGQLLVKVGKKRVCKRTATLFPNPKAVDTRVDLVRRALATRKVRRRHTKRMPANVRAKILRLLPKVLKRVDAGQAARSARASPRDGGCAAPEDSTYTSKDGNSTMTATMGADGFTLGLDGTTSAGIKFHFRYITNEGCNAFKVPACPQASGAVEASNTRSDDVIVEATQNGKVLSYTRLKGKRTTSATGQNAADAKLDYVRIDDVLSSSITVEGKGVPRTTFSGSFRRNAYWNMRTDSWDQSKFQVKITGDIQVDEDVAAFGNLVRNIRDAFRKAQDDGSQATYGWSKPESKCITMDWAPASDTIKVKKGNSGSVKGTLQAKTGGTAADGVTTVGGQANGTFSPSSANGATPSLSYTVTGDSGVLSMTATATSPAGAGSGEWHEPIEKSDSPNHISGPFSGTDSGSGHTVSWSGTATWKRAPNLDEGNTSRRYYLESASVDAHVSGSDGDCPVEGSGSFSVPAQPTQPSLTILNPASDVVNGSPDKDWVLPFTYDWAIYPPPVLDFPYTAHCPPDEGGDQHGSASVQVGFGHQGTTTDGVTFAGSATYDSGGETWSFTGSD